MKITEKQKILKKKGFFEIEEGHLKGIHRITEIKSIRPEKRVTVKIEEGRTGSYEICTDTHFKVYIKDNSVQYCPRGYYKRRTDFDLEEEKNRFYFFYFYWVLNLHNIMTNEHETKKYLK